MICNKCNKCNTYKKDLEKYKRKYETAKSGLTKEERNILIELLCNEQILHILPKVNDENIPEEYNVLEQLKAKVREL